MVSDMETQDGSPTPADARRALEQADLEERATRNRPVPAWYFPALALIVLAICALNAVAAGSPAIRVATIVAVLALAVGVGILVGRFSFSQPGYRNIRIRWIPTIISVVTALAFPIAAAVLAPLVGAWVWLPCGVVLAAAVWIMGRVYRKHQARV